MDAVHSEPITKHITPTGAEIIIPRTNNYGFFIKEPPNDEEVKIFIDQLRSNHWSFTHEDLLISREDKRILAAYIDKCPELPDFKEAQFKVFKETEFGLLEENFYEFPGFLLSPDQKSLDLESEIQRTCSYILNKHLKYSDDPARKINVGEFTYKIQKITITGFSRNRAELIVEVKKKRSWETRNGGVDFFVNETMPQLTGSYEKPRIKALTEFMSAYVNTHSESFIEKAERNEINLHRKKAANIIHALANHLIQIYEPKTFKVYLSEMVEDRTGMFKGNFNLYDLDRELFNTIARYRMKTFYEKGVPGKAKEIQEIRKERFLSSIHPEDREFYEGYIDQVHSDFQRGKPLRLRIRSKIMQV